MFVVVQGIHSASVAVQAVTGSECESCDRVEIITMQAILITT